MPKNCSNSSPALLPGAWAAGQTGGSIGLDLGLYNLSFYNQDGHEGMQFGLFGGEVRNDLYHGNIDTTLGEHFGVGINGYASVGETYMDDTFTVSGQIGPVNGSIGYNTADHYWVGGVGLGVIPVQGAVDYSTGYGWSFGPDGTRSGITQGVTISAPGIASAMGSDAYAKAAQNARSTDFGRFALDSTYLVGSPAQPTSFTDALLMGQPLYNFNPAGALGQNGNPAFIPTWSEALQQRINYSNSIWTIADSPSVSTLPVPQSQPYVTSLPEISADAYTNSSTYDGDPELLEDMRQQSAELTGGISSLFDGISQGETWASNALASASDWYAEASAQYRDTVVSNITNGINQGETCVSDWFAEAAAQYRDTVVSNIADKDYWLLQAPPTPGTTTEDWAVAAYTKYIDACKLAGVDPVIRFRQFYYYAEPTPETAVPTTDQSARSMPTMSASPDPSIWDYVTGAHGIVNNGTANAVDGPIHLLTDGLTSAAYNLTHLPAERPGLFEDQNPWQLNPMHWLGNYIGSTDLSTANMAYGPDGTRYGVMATTFTNGFILGGGVSNAISGYVSDGMLAAESTTTGRITGSQWNDYFIAKYGSGNVTWSWPGNQGFVYGADTYTTLWPNQLIDRIGGESGTFAAPYGTPLEMRALRPGTDLSNYGVYLVRRPIVDARVGPAAPAFDLPGYGPQIQLPKSISDLRADGSLILIKGPQH